VKKRIYRILYLATKFVPFFDEGIKPLWRIKNKVWREYLGVEGPIFVARHVQMARAHDYAGWFLRIGKHVEIDQGVWIDYSGGLEIGDMVTISAGARILTHSHGISDPNHYWRDQEITFNPLFIGSDSWIGTGAIILPQVTYIGQGAVIGAGSVVTKDVEPYCIVVGNPACVVGKRQGVNC